MQFLGAKAEGIRMIDLVLLAKIQECMEYVWRKQTNFEHSLKAICIVSPNLLLVFNVILQNAHCIRLLFS